MVDDLSDDCSRGYPSGSLQLSRWPILEPAGARVEGGPREVSAGPEGLAQITAKGSRRSLNVTDVGSVEIKALERGHAARRNRWRRLAV